MSLLGGFFRRVAPPAPEAPPAPPAPHASFGAHEASGTPKMKHGNWGQPPAPVVQQPPSFKEWHDKWKAKLKKHVAQLISNKNWLEKFQACSLGDWWDPSGACATYAKRYAENNSNLYIKNYLARLWSRWAVRNGVSFLGDVDFEAMSQALSEEMDEHMPADEEDDGEEEDAMQALDGEEAEVQVDAATHDDEEEEDVGAVMEAAEEIMKRNDVQKYKHLKRLLKINLDRDTLSRASRDAIKKRFFPDGGEKKNAMDAAEKIMKEDPTKTFKTLKQTLAQQGIELTDADCANIKKRFFPPSEKKMAAYINNILKDMSPSEGIDLREVSPPSPMSDSCFC